jgi:hypothetical protein
VAEYLKKEEEPLYGEVSSMTYSEKKNLARIVEGLQFKQQFQSWLKERMYM